MMLMNYDFELRFAEWCPTLTFSIMAESYDDAVNRIAATLAAAGANVRREEDVPGLEKPMLLRARRGKWHSTRI